MSKIISLKNFNKHIDDYGKLRESMNHQPSSIHAAKKDLKAVKDFLVEKNYKGINGPRLIEFVQWLSKDKNNCSGTINRKISSVKTYLNHLRLRQVPGAHDVRFEYMQRARDAYRGPIYTLTLQEVIMILDSFDTSTVLGVRNKTLFSLVYGCGLRIGEAVAIKINNIDFKQKTILIQGKGKRQRLIPILDHQVIMIRNWIKLRSNLMNAATNKSLFISKKGNQLSVRRAEEVFKETVDSLGKLSIQKVVPHTLRHAFATHAVDGNCDLVVLKAILGHAYLKTTELYVHPSIECQRDAMSKHVANEKLEEYKWYEKKKIRIQKHKKLIA